MVVPVPHQVHVNTSMQVHERKPDQAFLFCIILQQKQQQARLASTPKHQLTCVYSLPAAR